MTLDTAAIERLYRSHGHAVLRRARLLLGNEADAQEALQEVFAALLRAPQDLRSAGSALGWLYQATTHFCLNQLRNRRTGARLSTRPTSGSSRRRDDERVVRCRGCRPPPARAPRHAAAGSLPARPHRRTAPDGSSC